MEQKKNLEVDLEEIEIAPDYGKWRNSYEKLNFAAVAAVFMVELVISAVLLVMDRLYMPVLNYALLYVVMPVFLNVASLCAYIIVSRKYEDRDDVLNNQSIMTFVIILTVVATTHCVYPVLLGILSIPVFMTIPFCDKKLCTRITLACYVGVTIAALNYVHSSSDSLLWCVLQYVMAVLMIYWSAKLAQAIINMISSQNKKLIDAVNAAELAKKREQHANKAKSSFLATMSHEIRTPINAILGLNEMVIREEPSEEIKNYSLDIKSAGNQLLYLIKDILDFSKIESGKMDILEEEYEIGSLVHDCYTVMVDRARKKNLELEIVSETNFPVKLKGDPSRIQQIIINLLTNGVKYTDIGKVTLKVEGYDENDKFFLKIEVSDTGHGIKKEDLGRLFEKFTRVNMEKNKNVEGTGLGLEITKRLAELMGGNISVESEYGKGSIFTVIIPQEIIDNRRTASIKCDYSAHKNDEVYEQSFEAPDRTVLVVDDVQMNLVVFKGLLKKTKINVETALSGPECLRLAAKKKYDIIFMDHMMPDMDGIETLQHLREDEKSINFETPVVMLTANAIAGVKSEYLNQGFDEYLSKPINPKELERKIMRVLYYDSSNN